MSNLVVVGFDEPHKAEEVRLRLQNALTDVGINDHFMKEFVATLIPSSSALFVLTRSPSPDRDRMLEELKGLGGKILMTSLSHEDEARLQAALSATKSASP